MAIIKTKNQKMIASIIVMFLLVGAFCLFIFLYIKVGNENKPKPTSSEQEQLTYIQVMNSKEDSSERLDFYESDREGENVFWLGKVSHYYSQNSGIKFCVIDDDHKDIDINKPCDWFWASSNDNADASDLKIDFSKYKKDCDMSYWVKGKINGIDCAYDICVPDIEIISILEAPGPFCEVNE